MAKKRKMPAHIVLPNGMWRFVKSGTKKAVRAVKSKRIKRKRVSRGVVRMARRKRVSHKRGIMSGSGAGSLAKSALIGIGGAHLAGYIPVNVPYKEEAVGAIAAYLMGGKNIKSAAVGAGAVYLTKMASGTQAVSSSGNY